MGASGEWKCVLHPIRPEEYFLGPLHKQGATFATLPPTDLVFNLKYNVRDQSSQASVGSYSSYQQVCFGRPPWRKHSLPAGGVNLALPVRA